MQVRHDKNRLVHVSDCVTFSFLLLKLSETCRKKYTLIPEVVHVQF